MKVAGAAGVRGKGDWGGGRPHGGPATEQGPPLHSALTGILQHLFWKCTLVDHECSLYFPAQKLLNSARPVRGWRVACFTANVHLSLDVARVPSAQTSQNHSPRSRPAKQQRLLFVPLKQRVTRITVSSNTAGRSTSSVTLETQQALRIQVPQTRPARSALTSVRRTRGRRGHSAEVTSAAAGGPREREQ